MDTMSTSAGPSKQLRNQRSGRTQTARGSATQDPANKIVKSHTRSRDGCYTCRLRRKKCDETHPICDCCATLGVDCEWNKPSWWASEHARNMQKEKVKRITREAKVMRSETALQEYIKHAVSSSKARHTPVSKPQQQETITYDPSTFFLPTPTTGAMTTPMVPNLYGFDPSVGSSTFIPETPALQNTQNLMFNAMTTSMLPNSTLIPTPVSITTSPPTTATIATTTAATIPAPQREEWYQGFTSTFRVQPPLPLGPSDFPTRPLSRYVEGKMSTNDRERYLLYHFVDNVLQLVFPILDLHKQAPSRIRNVLQSLDSNKSYYHCCLSISAIHLKTVKKQRGKRVEDDIIRHRFATISGLVRTMYTDTGHDTVLDATLAMILFHTFVGSPDGDDQMDVSWQEHYHSMTKLINKLGLMMEANYYTIPSFSVSLSTWIDILGATMLGKSPQFSHAYRNKHLSGVSSGLRELMGCDDRIMYLISEIACLETMKGDGLLDDYTILNQVSLMTAQLDHAEQSILEVPPENPMPSAGILQPDKLTKNISAFFLAAARIYLYSLAPGFHPSQQNVLDLVETVGSLLQFIPSGPFGYDRSLVWPLLITGAWSTPTSNFRIILEQRVSLVGTSSDFGSIGRMYTVLQEVWTLSDDSTEEPMFFDSSMPGPSSAPAAAAMGYPGMGFPIPSSFDPTPRRVKKPLHWRDVMTAREWNYLLI
ncbi:fungal-specific transcription factor domain-containing protein [Aspergillus karnatakaensis]|uniref:Zn(II)2Cys6 transcription factor n=1 Tax=Aspergillus karnatakaensis TaxID=1810916 RepID=UPI003CCE328C